MFLSIQWTAVRGTQKCGVENNENKSPPVIVYKLSESVSVSFVDCNIVDKIRRTEGRKAMCFSLFSLPRGRGSRLSNLANSKFEEERRGKIREIFLI